MVLVFTWCLLSQGPIPGDVCSNRHCCHNMSLDVTDDISRIFGVISREPQLLCVMVEFLSESAGYQQALFSPGNFEGTSFSLINGILVVTIPPRVSDPSGTQQVLWRLYCCKEVRLYALSRLEPRVTPRLRVARSRSYANTDDYGFGFPTDDSVNGLHLPLASPAGEPWDVHHSRPHGYRFAVTFRMTVAGPRGVLNT